MAGMPSDHGSAAFALAALAAAHALPAVAKPVPPIRALLRIESRTSSGVALTFDDGPHPQGTPAVLEALRSRGAPATFFLVGEQIARSPGLAAEVVAAGHSIALHCDRHRNMLRLTPWQVRDDIERAFERIVAATGVEPVLHRAPYGVYSAGGLWAARRRGLRPVLWTHWGRDWEARATSESIARLASSNLHEGSVILLHDADTYSSPDSWRRTVRALPLLIDAVQQAGLAFRPL
jgi:peptidoglycan/xylan/chitin deacetylase (PgdA/CDA1 family)